MTEQSDLEASAHEHKYDNATHHCKEMTDEDNITIEIYEEYSVLGKGISGWMNWTRITYCPWCGEKLEAKKAPRS